MIWLVVYDICNFGELLICRTNLLIIQLCHRIICELCKYPQSIEIQSILIIQIKHIALQCSFTESHLFNHLKFISYE